jgi:hypothetical protein
VSTRDCQDVPRHPRDGTASDNQIPRWTMSDDQPVMTALAEITAVSLLHSNLPAREHMIARLAALVAVDAPTASYVMNASTAAETGITVEDVQSLLVAVAPLVGTSRIVTAAERITEALGFVIELAVAELVAELDAEDAAGDRDSAE